ncbi:hypothetical protein [Burkholderia diffusa]
MFDTILAGGGIGVVQAPACGNALAHGKRVAITTPDDKLPARRLP